MAPSKNIVVPWKGGQITTYSECIDIIKKMTTREEGEELIKAYVKAGFTRKIFLSNIGYFVGYYDAKTARKVFDILPTEHPIFGKSIAKEPVQVARKIVESGLKGKLKKGSKATKRVTRKRK